MGAVRFSRGGALAHLTFAPVPLVWGAATQNMILLAWAAALLFVGAYIEANTRVGGGS